MNREDGLPVFDAESGDRSPQNFNVNIDASKHMAVVVVCAIVCGVCAAVSWWAVNEQRVTADKYRSDYLYTQDEFQKERNHVIELEARLKVLGDEVQEIKHVRR